MAIISGDDVVIMTKDDARKILNFIRGGVSRMTREKLEKLIAAGLSNLVDDLVRITREPEDIEE